MLRPNEIVIDSRNDPQRVDHREEARSTNAWYRTLPKEKRKAIRELHRIHPRYNSVVLVFILLWLGAGLLMHWLPEWPVQLAGYVLIGFLLHGLANLMHEGIHNNIFRRPKLDRWVSFLVAAPVFVPASAYRVIHLLHHQHNRSEHDPDEITNLTHHTGLLQVIYYAWLLLGMFVYVLIRLPWKAFRLGSAVDRRQILGEYALLLLGYTTVVLLAVRYGFVDGLLHYWIFPAIFTGLFANLRGWAEHMLTTPGHPLLQTRTVTSTKLLSFLNVNLNYHLEHHLFPAVPWYNLPRIHALLQEEYEQAGAFIYSSYLRFLIDAFRSGFHGVVRERA